MIDLVTGLYAKYHVTRVVDPLHKHSECAFFVLDPQHDPIARVALDAYAAEANKNGYHALAMDLWGWVNRIKREERE